MKKRGARSQRRHEYMLDVAAHTRTSFRGRIPPGHHLDHIVPKSYGFTHGIAAARIGASCNLQVLPANENLQKGARLTPAAHALLEAWDT